MSDKPIAYEISFDIRNERLARVLFWLISRLLDGQYICGYCKPIFPEDIF